MNTASASIPEIRVLSEVVQNKIAAGEVVERPASVVKELCENAIDAGARQIAIDLEEGGHRLVRVADDGHGMDEANLVRAVERHATSKIADVEDIFRIHTMGFRGEALPSIGSVAKLTIDSALHGADEGHLLLVEGGRMVRVRPSAPRAGTVVEVRDLFFNTPARRKFQRAAGAEVAAISEALTRLALAHPRVGFKLTNGGRRSLECPPHRTLVERILHLFGRGLAERLAPVSYLAGEGALRVEGFAALPPESRANTRTIYSFLNRRWIRHPGLARVVSDAYAGMLPPRRFPFAVLYLDLDPARVDVNVHPTKEEVRFENDRLVLGGVRHAVQEALAEAAVRGRRVTPPAAEMEGDTECEGEEASTAGEPGAAAAFEVSRASPTERPRDASPGSAFRERAESGMGFAAGRDGSGGMRGAVRGGPGAADPASLSLARQRDGGALTPTEAAARRAALGPVIGRDPTQMTGTVDRQAPVEASTSTPAQGTMDLGGEVSTRVVGQVGGRYLVVETETGIRLVDQHALHERWNYDRLMDRESSASSQGMLTPVVIELSPGESALFDEALPALRAAGFGVERFGDHALSVSEHPAIMAVQHIEQVVRDLFQDLRDGEGRRDGDGALRSVRERVCASLACRAAVLFGARLSHEAVVELLRKYDQARMPLTCPHGRPTTIDLGWEELARRFGRH